ncbi:DUF3422 family protein [Thalassorhabdomicrobium marinisediminis]|uniref:DUF3422 domain-containing protein n=1 Tax=Thalassorhabdomicrobium marinisediminis TaxID=2170577 RepID=A0A2T7G0J5_9RHOB|nr:DUF3422 domain-containing protein [Thalassorhabdomicrobium marinisediminis]PVA07929.1 DUF3422 domain-containing protein [Thalassorhabdomicrobium marinisediminis]
MSSIADHPLRYELSNELHARPFPTISAPGQALFLALKPAANAAGRDRGADMVDLLRLLDRFGAPHPRAGATHYSGPIGKHMLKWESHTEFVTYTIFDIARTDRPFADDAFDIFPKDWLAGCEATRITSAVIRIERTQDTGEILARAEDWFVPESLAISRVLEDELVIAGDFRIDHSGHTRFAVFAGDTCDDRRIGRVVQRLCEIETYKSMAMLGLARVRALAPRVAQVEDKLASLSADMLRDGARPDDLLQQLLVISAELENEVAQSAFRFGATEAYEAIVSQRITILREGSFEGMQTFRDFMTRRFDPAMRTVTSSRNRLESMSNRAMRASNLLRTRVDVERSAQNQSLLESMDRRADLQLRLQHTVEGLSVVAISYYAANLVLYVLAPLREVSGIPKAAFTAAVVPVVVALVWLTLRQVRKRLTR